MDTWNYEDFLQYLNFEVVTKEMVNVSIERIRISKEKMMENHWIFTKRWVTPKCCGNNVTPDICKSCSNNLTVSLCKYSNNATAPLIK